VQILSSNKNCKILFLCGTKHQMFELQEQLITFSKNINVVNYLPNLKNNGIFFSCYQSILRVVEPFDYNFFDLIICDELGFLSDKYIYPFFSNKYDNKRLSISNSPYNKLTKNDELIFEYNLIQALNDGYINTTKEKSFLEEFLPTFLSYFNFENIRIKNNFKDYGIDLTAIHDNKTYVFEIKTYRTKYVSSDLIESSCHVFLSVVKNLKDVNPVMIVTSIVDNELKEQIFNDTNIEIWDISNLLFLCNLFPELANKLKLYIPYPISDIKPLKPIAFRPKKSDKSSLKSVDYYKKFEDQLSNCLTGKMIRKIRNSKKFVLIL